MSRITLTILAALTVGPLSAPAIAQPLWRPLPIRMQAQYNLGLPGGEGEQHMQGMTRCLSEPDIIYLSHDCAQVWRSDNGGELWHKVRGEGMLVTSGQSIQVDPVHPNIVIAHIDSSYNYISRPYEGLYRSTDYGESWDLVLQADSDQQRFHQECIAYDPASVTADGAQRWYAALYRAGLFRSDDAGVTWVKVADLSSFSAVYAVKAHISDGQTVYVGTSSGLYRSTSRGVGLAKIGNLPSGAVSSIATHPTDPDTIVVALRDSGVYRSTDGGATFTRILYCDAHGVEINQGYPDTMFVTCLDSDVRVTHDGGATWRRANVLTPPGFSGTWKNAIEGGHSALSLDPSDPDVAMGYGHASLWRTEDGGNTFFDSSGLFTGYNWGWWYDGVAYDVEDPNRFVFLCADVGLVITENGGLWWERRSAPYEWYTSGQVSWRGEYASAMYPETGSETILGAIGMYWDCRVFRTTDAGVSDWTLVETAPENYLFIEYNTDDPSIVYAGDRRSTNGGLSFSAIPYLDGHDASIMGMCRAQPDTVYAMSKPREMIFRSDDAGVTWRLYTRPGWSFNGMDSKPTFAVDPIDPDVIYTLDRHGDLARFDGTTWTSLNVVDLAGDTPYRNFVPGVAIDPNDNDIIYAQLFAAGYPFLYRTVDGGATWEDITGNLSRTGTGSINIHPLTGDLMFSSCCGTWIYPPPYTSPDSIYPNAMTVPPTARAGADFTVEDTDGDGAALLVLDGSASTSPDAGITEYLWTTGQTWLGEGETLTTLLPVGEHTVRLRITDGTGFKDEDTVVVTVTDASAVPGDTDGDGDVDLDDFATLKINFGTSSGATRADGDFDGDGDVDLDDFAILKQHFGT
ncbi:MAG: dockerin type I domain-containing protein [Planctomycetota bacterium]